MNRRLLIVLTEFWKFIVLTGLLFVVSAWLFNKDADLLLIISMIVAIFIAFPTKRKLEKRTQEVIYEELRELQMNSSDKIVNISVGIVYGVASLMLMASLYWIFSSMYVFIVGAVWYVIVFYVFKGLMYEARGF